MTEYELPKLHPNTDYIRKAVARETVFGKDDVLTRRMEIAREGVRLPNGMLLGFGSLVLEKESIPLLWNGMPDLHVGTATDLEREGDALFMSITAEARLIDLGLYSAGGYADSLVVAHQDDLDVIVWGRLQAVYLTANPGFPKDWNKKSE